MRTRLPVEELLRLAREASYQGHYGTFMARARELGAQLEDTAFKDGYTAGNRDRITAERTQHKPMLNEVKDQATAWGLYNQLTKVLNEGAWDVETVLEAVHTWVTEQQNRDYLLHYVMEILAEGIEATKQLKPAEE